MLRPYLGGEKGDCFLVHSLGLQRMNDEPVATIFFDGKPAAAYPGDTVASALYRAGQRIFSRSFKYHRPRGLLCGAGRCPNCLVNVDGTPNVRACTEPVPVRGCRSGTRTPTPRSNEIGWPLPSGSTGYCRSASTTRRLLNRSVWRLVEPADPPRGRPRRGGRPRADDLRRRTGLRAPLSSIPTWRSSVAVPAGIAAAIAAAQQGRRVTLVDDQPELGGHLRYTGRSADGDGSCRDGAGADCPAGRHCLACRCSRPSTCLGLYEGHLLGIVQQDRVRQSHVRERLVQLRAAEDRRRNRRLRNATHLRE